MSLFSTIAAGVAANKQKAEMRDDGVRNIVSFSGGKDSLALLLWAMREGLSPVPVYIDTGWEWEGHYAYVGDVEKRLGIKIHKVAADLLFKDLVLKKRTFPSRVRKWCTEELKLKPFRNWLDSYRDEHGVDVRVLLGIRREESAKRADPVRTPEREFSDFYDCEVWRPILDWPVERVIGEITSAGLPVHPLYREGAERVGCFPCVNASKAELALVGRLAPDRVEEIKKLEVRVGATMFTKDRRAEKRRTGEGPSVVPIGIEEVIEWSKTERGGKKLALVQPRTGCARWGVCDLKKNGNESEE